jgi:hypothetical protein
MGSKCEAGFVCVCCVARFFLVQIAVFAGPQAAPPSSKGSMQISSCRWKFACCSAVVCLAVCYVTRDE